MANPQKERGHVGIANELWDEIIRRDFTKRQKDIMQFILRLSYGCGRKTALIPRQKDFEICGVREGHIKTEIDHLIKCKVIERGSQKGEYRFNKNYDFWQVTPVFLWDEVRMKELIRINLLEAKKDRNLTESGSFEEDENLPNQEVNEISDLTETVSFEEKNLLKQEDGLTETVRTNADEPSQDAGSGAPKKGLKKKDIKKDLNTIHVEIISYLNEKTGKRFSAKTKSTIESINGRLGEGYTLDDFKHVIDVKTDDWLHDAERKQYLCPDTLFRPSKFEKYRNQDKKVSVPKTAGVSGNVAEKQPGISDEEAEKIMKELGIQ